MFVICQPGPFLTIFVLHNFSLSGPCMSHLSGHCLSGSYLSAHCLCVLSVLTLFVFTLAVRTLCIRILFAKILPVRAYPSGPCIRLSVSCLFGLASWLRSLLYLCLCLSVTVPLSGCLAACLAFSHPFASQLQTCRDLTVFSPPPLGISDRLAAANAHVVMAGSCILKPRTCLDSVCTPFVSTLSVWTLPLLILTVWALIV